MNYAKSVENMAGNRENVEYQHFLCSLKYFQKLLFFSLEGRKNLEWMLRVKQNETYSQFQDIGCRKLALMVGVTLL